MIPSTIRIRRKTWRIFMHDDPALDVTIHADWEHRQKAAKDLKKCVRGKLKHGRLLGLTYRKPLFIIVLYNSGDETEMMTALLHELMHACVKRRNPVLEDEAEEAFIDQIDGPLLQAVRQIKWT